MAQSHAHTDGHDHDHDAHSPRHYVKVYVGLLVLLAVSIVGPEVSSHMGAAGLYVMLITAFGIAFVKAWLVIKHFMHLPAEKPIAGYILLICLMFLVLFFAGVAPDVHNHDGANWTNLAAKAEIARGMAAHEAELAAGGEHGAHGEHTTTHEVPKPVVREPAVVVAPKKFTDMKTDAEKKAWLMKRGEDVYVATACVTCHRTNGAGHAAFPPLVGQKDHMGDCATTLGIIKGGMSAPITIGDTVYTMPMPPTPNISAEDAAAVATYVRNSWGNDYGVCAP